MPSVRHPHGRAFEKRVLVACSRNYSRCIFIESVMAVWRDVQYAVSVQYRCFSFSPTKSGTTRNERVPWTYLPARMYLSSIIFTVLKLRSYE